MDVEPGASWWEWLGGLAFAVVSGLFAYTHKRMSELGAELRGDQMEEIQSLRHEISKMEKTIEDRFLEGRNDRNEMWRTIRDNQAAQERQHAQNLERLNRIPTREEMMQLLQQIAGRPTH